MENGGTVKPVLAVGQPNAEFIGRERGVNRPFRLMKPVNLVALIW
jgi:hypothetical protein